MKIYVNGRFLTQRFTGVQKFAYQQLLKVCESYEVTLLVPKNANLDLLPPDLNVEILTIGQFSGHAWEQIDLYLYLKRNRNPPLLSFSGLAPIFYRNSIFTIHDISFKINKMWFSTYYSLWYGFSYFIMTKLCQRVLTVSHFSKDEILKFYPGLNGKISVVYNEIPQIKQNLSKVEVSKPYVLLVSSLDPRKNILKFVESFAEASFINIDLYIAGGGSASFSKMNYVQKSDNIKVLGYVSDQRLNELYSNAKLFVYPSLYEGFGLPPVEALSYRCPILVSDIGSLREVCGDYDFYFDPKSKLSIKEKLIDVLSSEEKLNYISSIADSQLELLLKKSEIFCIENALNESFATK
ncbi:glycosyltransferase family 4 protein [Vibrio vulnificus]|nr:glycosyltransferase family 4 protein [Vibrio vulnificus]EIZ1360378.1 glycosyltransferase family 4 protein [Vibrio vulnificus]